MLSGRFSPHPFRTLQQTSVLHSAPCIHVLGTHTILVSLLGAIYIFIFVNVISCGHNLELLTPCIVWSVLWQGRARKLLGGSILTDQSTAPKHVCGQKQNKGHPHSGGLALRSFYHQNRDAHRPLVVRRDAFQLLPDFLDSFYSFSFNLNCLFRKGNIGGFFFFCVGWFILLSRPSSFSPPWNS